ncbi:MAG: hypothetical protein II948_11660 [Synergistaceae bacterium]|nr:hypothetical protein [Synergistaceae bacterium]MBR0222420.1 hypothetical protein [Synergistaceae bacterium]
MAQGENINQTESGAVRPNGSDYVRQDVFDAHMRRIDERFNSMEILIDKKLTELRADLDVRFEKIESRFAQVESRFAQVESRFAQVNSRFDAVDTRLHNVETNIYWGFGFFALILAFLTFSPVVKALQNLFKPAVTLEDVERIVQAAIKQANINKA